MRGITGAVYRRVFQRHFAGLDCAMAPFIPTVSAERINPKLFRDVLPDPACPLPLIPQLIGNHADDAVRFAQALHELGYKEINWNLGCPWKHVRKKQRGSGLIPFPEKVEAFLDTFCADNPVALSVKIRLGLSAPDELLRLLPVLNRYPLRSLCIHPRTAEQMYAGPVDLEAFETAAALSAAPVWYNGDLNDRSFFESLRTRFPSIHTFMIGRGLLMNPFLPETLKGQETPDAEKLKRVQAFHDELAGEYRALYNDDTPLLGRLKEFWKYLGAHLTNGRALFKKLKKAQRADTALEIITSFLTEAEWSDSILWRGDNAKMEEE